MFSFFATKLPNIGIGTVKRRVKAKAKLLVTTAFGFTFAENLKTRHPNYFLKLSIGPI